MENVLVLLFLGAELAVRVFHIQSYIFPPPSEIIVQLVTRFPDLFWPHMQITLIEPERSLDELVAIGVASRPEIGEQKSLIQAAEARIQAVRRLADEENAAAARSLVSEGLRGNG